MPSLTYDVAVRRDGSVWLLEIAPIGGVAEARWLGEAEPVAREFIAQFEDADPETLDVNLIVEYPGGVEDHLSKAAEFRRKADEAADDEWAALENAARELDRAGVTRRDIGDILALPVPRVRRLLRGAPRERQATDAPD